MDLADQLELDLRDGSALTIPDICDRYDVQERTAHRAVQKLRDAGKLVAEKDGRRKVWRLASQSEHQPVTVSASQAISLYTWKGLFDQLEGSRFRDDIHSLCGELQRSFQAKEQANLRRLDRKFYERVESRISQAVRSEIGFVSGEIVDALIDEERIEVKHASVADGKRAFLLEPYTLVVFRRLLYVVGHSSNHKHIRTFALTGFSSVRRLEGQHFEYPSDYHPSQIVEGSFGIFAPREEVTDAVARFTAKARDYVERREWHTTQTTHELEISDEDDPFFGGIEWRVQVAGTHELESWLLGFGPQVEVLEPGSLRDRIAKEHRLALKRYSERAPKTG